MRNGRVTYIVDCMETDDWRCPWLLSNISILSPIDVRLSMVKLVMETAPNRGQTIRLLLRGQ